MSRRTAAQPPPRISWAAALLGLPLHSLLDGVALAASVAAETQEHGETAWAGLAVFLDGVRINEPFGDAVNWDLVPTAALHGVQLMPGSNPVFGLNTLGGALVLRTRNGRDDPGTEVEASAGSFGRRSLQLGTGGVRGDWDHFASLEVERDDGAREHGSSRVQRGFVHVAVSDPSDDDAFCTISDGGIDQVR